MTTAAECTTLCGSVILNDAIDATSLNIDQAASQIKMCIDLTCLPCNCNGWATDTHTISRIDKLIEGLTNYKLHASELNRLKGLRGDSPRVIESKCHC